MGFLSVLRTHQDAVQSWTDTISKIAQVLALALAGLWTYKTFYESERPALERRLNTSIAGAWAAVPNDKDICEITLNVSVENTGKQAADVTAISITGWLSNRMPFKGQTPQLFNTDIIERGQMFIDQTVTSGILIAHFPPAAQRTDSFVWYFKNDQDKVALWKIDFQTSKPTEFGKNTYFWDYVCRNLPNPAPSERNSKTKSSR